MPRQSAAVYRRRRLVTLVALILVLAVIGAAVWLLVARPWANASEASPVPTSSPAPSPSPSATDLTPSPTATQEGEAPTDGPSVEQSSGPVTCSAADVEVSAVTDAESYQAGALPKLSITLSNKSDRDCTMNVGSATQKFTITSGNDVWWRSTDCQTDPSDQIATLTAGATVSTKTPVVWDRTRSAVGTCDQQNRARAPGGGASYHVEVSIGGFTSTSTRQIILR